MDGAETMLRSRERLAAEERQRVEEEEAQWEDVEDEHEHEDEEWIDPDDRTGAKLEFVRPLMDALLELLHYAMCKEHTWTPAVARMAAELAASSTQPRRAC